MFSRRSWRALVLTALFVGSVVVPVTFSTAAQVVNANENAYTLTMSLPGPFNGCNYLDAGATSTSDAMLDLVLPSAFVTQANGTLVGEDGPIASAELTSLSPETVRYTITPNMTWSNGVPFSGADLLSWWHRAKALPSVLSDGYRAIKTLTESSDGSVVTAVFAKSYSDWNQLFRDVEERGSSSGCAIGNLLSRPSLGAYFVSSASRHRVVLAMNPNWTLYPNRYGRIVITDSQALPKNGHEVYADYTTALSSTLLNAISTQPTLLTRVASSSNIEEMTFAPSGVFTRSKVVREALSWSIGRQQMIDQIYGAVTLQPQVSASAIYSQGQSQYPGTSSSGLSGQTTTTTTTPTGTTNGLSDCMTCAVDVLEKYGYSQGSSGWVNHDGRVVNISVGIGPSVLDHHVANIVAKDWRSFGFTVHTQNEGTDELAARASASGRVDVAVFARPTTTAPSFAARSWAGPAYADSYPSGVRTAAVTNLFTQAAAIFNPVTAASTWLQLDQIVMKQYWVRPLFTAPSLAVWTSTLTTVANSFTVAGFVDQEPSWSVAPTVPTS